MVRYACRVEYNGEPYSGWQVQPNTLTVQSEIERVLAVIFSREVPIVCGGRTDAGVHGRGQSIHFDLDEEVSLYKLDAGVNALLPDTIAIYSLKRVADDFHARFSATKREYLYSVVTRKSPLAPAAYYYSYEVDWDLIRSQLKYLMGEHTFTSFCSVGYYSQNHNCNIELAEIEEAEGVYTIRIVADRFVYKMVRAIVGTLLDIGRGRITMELDEIILAKDREVAGLTAPAHGLVFEWVHYDDF